MIAVSCMLSYVHIIKRNSEKKWKWKRKQKQNGIYIKRKCKKQKQINTNKIAIKITITKQNEIEQVTVYTLYKTITANNKKERQKKKEERKTEKRRKNETKERKKKKKRRKQTISLKDSWSKKKNHFIRGKIYKCTEREREEKVIKKYILKPWDAILSSLSLYSI